MLQLQQVLRPQAQPMQVTVLQQQPHKLLMQVIVLLLLQLQLLMLLLLTILLMTVT
jgi:hypothetical protein